MPTQTFKNLPQEKQDRVVNAAVSEFAKYTYNEVKLSNIIKSASIPRGSFYQYFDDKKDLYKHIFDHIAQEKLKYMSDLLPNPEHTPFLDLFYDMYVKGLEFALANPDFIRIAKNLFSIRGDIYDELIGDNMNIAKNYFMGYITEDKKLGRIREDIDSELLAELCTDSLSTIAFNELQHKDTIDGDNMLRKVSGMLKILKKGIE